MRREYVSLFNRLICNDLSFQSYRVELSKLKMSTNLASERKINSGVALEIEKDKNKYCVALFVFHIVGFINEGNLRTCFIIGNLLREKGMF
jgi:hypothetical protein